MMYSTRFGSVLVGVITLALQTGALPASVRAVEPNIPGTPLTRNVVQGQVGGSVVDEVFSVNVPSGSVLVATLRGEAGAELGLYLFDASATSVLVDAPIAQSAKPGSNQVISVALEAGGTFFLNVNGRNVERGYGYTLSYSYARDTSAPLMVDVELPSRAQSASVCANVAARDSISGVRAIRIRDRSNPTLAVWQQYSGRGQYCAELSAGEGAREVDVAVKNGVGLVTTSRSFAVVIDDTPPQLTGTRPSQGGILFEPQGTITWRFNEDVTLTASESASVYAVDQLGRPIRGTTLLLDDGRRVRWSPESRIPVASMMMIALVGVTDVAGNQLPLIDTLEVYRKQRAQLSIRLTSIGTANVRIEYDVSANLVGRELFVEIREGGTWSPITVLSPSASIGRVRIERGAWDAVRFRWEGDERVAAVTSATLKP